MTERHAADDYDVGIPIPGQDPATWPRGAHVMIDHFSKAGPNGEPPLRLVLLDVSEPPAMWHDRIWDVGAVVIGFLLMPLWFLWSLFRE